MRYLVFTLLLLPIVIGCSNSNLQGRVPVRGEVIFDGKPLEQGDILFLSIEGSTPMVATGSLIKNGKFSLSAEKGLIPDQTYSVQFRSIEKIPSTRNETNKPSKDRTIRIQTRSILPRRYGVESKEIVTATKKSPNVFQFDLTSDIP
ncbi:MAG: hypothetical protein LBK82_17170 [Planctomycetaceae bacterium]|jgi:hypothetical protein|nr:hypothetical protein [Planctomycetaceae bacterium]